MGLNTRLVIKHTEIIYKAGQVSEVIDRIEEKSLFFMWKPQGGKKPVTTECSANTDTL